MGRNFRSIIELLRICLHNPQRAARIWLTKLYASPPFNLHPCAPLSALLNLYKCSLCLPLWRCFLLSLDSVLFQLDMLGGGRGCGIKYCTYRCAGYSPFYYAATLSRLHYVCATLAAPHFAAAAAFATLRIYYKFLHTIYCLSVPPSHGQAVERVGEGE